MQLQTIKVEYQDPEGGARSISVRAADEADALARLEEYAASLVFRPEADLEDAEVDGTPEDETKDVAGDETDDTEVETESTENDPEA